MAIRGMVEGKCPGVECDASRLRMRQPCPVAAIADDGAAARRQLGPKLVPTPGRRCQLDQRHLAGALDDARSRVSGPNGRAVCRCDSGGWLAGGGGARSDGRRALAWGSDDIILPVLPFPQRRWEPSFDHGDIGLVDTSLPELSGEVCRGSGRPRDDERS
jgi:hypothetical protein